ncbi:amidohydrolase [Microbacterium hominis]|uniref:amidohydrolase n=1 Tax=Microbacterium hominis TaxID=162426 RepID=UPI00077CBF4F|nr:amidohydrolase [Microbacterium hominis]
MSELIVTGGAVFDGVQRIDAEAVGVRDGVIVAVGARDEVRRGLPHADELDAAGGLIAPSFADAHVHLGLVALEGLDCTLDDTGSERGCLERIRAHAEALADPQAWVRGGGWRAEWFAGGTPSRAALDAVVPDRPVLLLDSDRHGAWANSRALALAGIDRTTPDPPDGRIVRDADGEPQGTLREGAVDLVGRIAPQPGPDALAPGIRTAADHLLSLGVTGWQEAALASFGSIPDFTDAYLLARAAGMRGRPTGAVWVPRDLTVDAVADFVAGLRERADRADATGFPTRTAKLMLDGIVESETAALRGGYPDGSRGLSYFPDEVVHAVVAQVNAAGIPVHVHAIGDAAVAQALDAFAAAGPAPHGVRNHIAHVQVVDPADVPRFAATGTTVNAQALWACRSEVMRTVTAPLLGPQRSAWQFPFGSLWRSGAALAMGSDWPVSAPDPWAAIGVAVTRREADHPDVDPLGADESLPLAVALAAYTSGSHALIGDGAAGRIRVGAAADLAIADRDPFAGADDEIARTRNAWTIAAGHVIDARRHSGAASADVSAQACPACA